MHAERFYTTQADDHTVGLTLLTPSMCSSGFPTLSAFERNCLIGQGFTGCLGDLGRVHDDTGRLSQVYVGASDRLDDALAMATVVTMLPGGCYRFNEPLSFRAHVVWSLAQYQFDQYKPADVSPRVLVIEKSERPSILAEADAIFLVRDLINTPTNDLGPKELANRVETLAKAHGAHFRQWVGQELLDENFPAIHAVGRAASAKPRLLSMVWGKEEHPRVALIGKGVCFDSGGLDLKPSSGMRWMKKDMGGAAHVLGLAQWLMTHQVPIRLHVLIPAVENAVSAEAYRPGDVLTMRNGMTVEIHNTDAEGRLVLADALVKACEDNPELVIDFATLTGAARVAVGTDIAAMFVNDDQLADAILESSKGVNDPIWRMPLFEGYNELFNSKIADCSNASESPYAGAITAALFLKRFIPAHIPWAHFDIMAWNVSSKPGRPEGGEAMGLLAMAHYLRMKYA